MEVQDWTAIYVYLSMLGAAAFVWVTMDFLPWHKITLYLSVVAISVLGLVVLLDNVLRSTPDCY